MRSRSSGSARRSSRTGASRTTRSTSCTRAGSIPMRSRRWTALGSSRTTTTSRSRAWSRCATSATDASRRCTPTASSTCWADALRRARAGLGRAHETADVALGELPVAHQLVRLGDLAVGVRVAERRDHLALAHEVVEGQRLLVVHQVGALVALLQEPEVAHVDHRVVAGRAGADNDHPAAVADEVGGRDRVLTRVVEDDPRVHLLAERIPEGLAERLRAVEPALPIARVPRGRDAPVVEVLPVDIAHGAQLLRVCTLLVGR